MLSQQVFDRTAGHHSLAKLIHEINHQLLTKWTMHQRAVKGYVRLGVQRL